MPVDRVTREAGRLLKKLEILEDAETESATHRFLARCILHFYRNPIGECKGAAMFIRDGKVNLTMTNALRLLGIALILIILLLNAGIELPWIKRVERSAPALTEEQVATVARIILKEQNANP